MIANEPSQHVHHLRHVGSDLVASFHLDALISSHGECRVGVKQGDDPEEEAKQRSFTSLLNKLTVDNFDRIVKRMVAIDVVEARTLKGFVKKIFNKALVESIFAELYARLCKELLQTLPRYGPPEST